MSLIGRLGAGFRNAVQYAWSPRTDLAGPIKDTLNMGNFTVETVKTFQSLLNTFSKTFDFRYDEAMKQSPQFALAMRRDPFYRALLQERLMPLARWKWSLVPPDPMDREQIDRAKWYEKVVRKQPRLSKKLLYLGHAVWYGRYGSQNEYIEDTVQDDRWPTCKRIMRHAPVNGDKIVHNFNDGCPGIRINPMFASEYPQEDITYDNRGTAILMLRRPEYRKKFTIHIHEMDDADYFESEMAGRVEGIGLRDFVYFGAHLRSRLIEFAVSFMEKVGTLGLMIFRYPEGNAEAKRDAERAAREASNKNALAIPMPKGSDKGSSSAELLPANMTGVQFLVDIIAGWWERHSERLFIGQQLSTGGGDSAGSLGGSERANFAKDTKFNLLQFDAEGLEETLTHDEIKVLCELNGDSGWDLQWKFALPDPDGNNKLEALAKAASLPGKKLKFKASEVRELTGTSEPGPDDEIVGGDPPMPGAPGAPGTSPANPDEQVPGTVGGESKDALSQLFEGLDGGEHEEYDTQEETEEVKPSANGKPVKPSANGKPKQEVTYAWKQHQILSGPRKGQEVWKNDKTGKIRDTAPAKAGSTPGGGDDVESDPKEHVKALLALADQVPADVQEKADQFVRRKYDKLAAKHGEEAARSVLAGMILLTPIPEEGGSLLPAAIALAVKNLWEETKGEVDEADDETETPPEPTPKPVQYRHRFRGMLNGTH